MHAIQQFFEQVADFCERHLEATRGRQIGMTFDFTGRDEADIEDLFDVDFYLKLVSAEFKAGLAKPIAESDLPATDERILMRLEEYFEANPLKKESFNHYRPARYFVENVATLKGDLSKDTLDKFEAAAKALNALL